MGIARDWRVGNFFYIRLARLGHHKYVDRVSVPDVHVAIIWGVCSGDCTKVGRAATLDIYPCSTWISIDSTTFTKERASDVEKRLRRTLLILSLMWVTTSTVCCESVRFRARHMHLTAPTFKYVFLGKPFG